MSNTNHVTKAELESGIGDVRQSPATSGRLELIVRRPETGDRDVIEAADLDVSEGLVGDNWSDRRSSMTSDGSPHPDMQINIMGARAIALIAGEKQRWPLAGDQLYVDLDLSEKNLPPGTRLEVETSVLEVTEVPHRGCGKFAERFGPDAARFVNSSEGKQLNLRGVNARVVQSGTIRTGDVVRRTDGEVVRKA